MAKSCLFSPFATIEQIKANNYSIQKIGNQQQMQILIREKQPKNLSIQMLFNSLFICLIMTATMSSLKFRTYIHKKVAADIKLF